MIQTTAKNKVIIGSRESRLAVLQSEMVRDYIKEQHPGLDVEILTMKTTGDKILDRTLDKVGGKGLFVKELDKALMDKLQKTLDAMKADGAAAKISTKWFGKDIIKP